MTTLEVSCEQGDAAIEKAYGISLADVIERVEKDESLTSARRRQLSSGVRTACRVMGANPRFVPAEPRNLRVRLNAIGSSE